jgi:hypothetical protein
MVSHSVGRAVVDCDQHTDRATVRVRWLANPTELESRIDPARLYRPGARTMLQVVVLSEPVLLGAAP